MLAQILVVEDDPHLGPLLKEYLSADYQVHHAATLRDAQSWLGMHSAQLILLDLNLPDGDGLDLVQALRQYSSTPVLVLSARSGVQERVAGLNAGADDYLTKPFDFAELGARLRALARRAPPERPAVLAVGDLRLDPAERRVYRGEVEIAMSATEMALLEAFMRRPGQVLDALTLLEAGWPDVYENRSNVVAVYIGYLRNKIDRPFGRDDIETVRGSGYRLRRPEG